MRIRKSTVVKSVLLSLAALAISACQKEEPLSFARDVKPTLDQYCLSCHKEGGAGFAASGLDMSSYEGLMKGTNNGPMVIAGDSLGSNLIVLM